MPNSLAREYPFPGSEGRREYRKGKEIHPRNRIIKYQLIISSIVSPD
jgi:hypothetical protein